jgi:hypothetical protein
MHGKSRMYRFKLSRSERRVEQRTHLVLSEVRLVDVARWHEETRRHRRGVGTVIGEGHCVSVFGEVFCEYAAEERMRRNVCFSWSFFLGNLTNIRIFLLQKEHKMSHDVALCIVSQQLELFSNYVLQLSNRNSCFPLFLRLIEWTRNTTALRK